MQYGCKFYFDGVTEHKVMIQQTFEKYGQNLCANLVGFCWPGHIFVVVAEFIMLIE